MSETPAGKRRKRAINLPIAEKIAIVAVIGRAKLVGKISNTERIAQVSSERRLSPARIAALVHQLTEEIPNWEPTVD